MAQEDRIRHEQEMREFKESGADMFHKRSKAIKKNKQNLNAFANVMKGVPKSGMSDSVSGPAIN